MIKAAENYAKEAIKLFDKKQPDLAIEQYRKTIEIQSQLPLSIYRKLGNILVNEELWEEAITFFKIAIKNFPDDPILHGFLGRIFAQQSKIKNAIYHYKQSLELDSNPQPWVYKRLFNQLCKNNQFEEAENIYQKMSKKYPDEIQTYSCGVEIAIVVQEWELALKRLESALSFFPHHLNLILKKITVLENLYLFDSVKETIAKGKKDFPNQVDLDLAEYQVYKKQYDYQTAQHILEIAISKEPNNLQAQLALANNYYCLGQKQTALEILNQIRPKINKGYLLRNFTELYIKVLLGTNKISELKTFLVETVSNSASRKLVILNYPQFLISQGQYAAASKFMTEILEEHLGDILGYKQQILAIFELEKIKNIQAFSNFQLNNDLKYQGHKNLYSLLDKVKLYLQKYPEFATVNSFLIEKFNKINQLAEKYPHVLFNTEISPQETSEVASEIIKHIKNKTPFSLIRIADGEGMFLEYKEEWQKFQDQDREFIQRVWWGGVRINRDEWQKIASTYKSAIQNADLLGIPEAYRICRAFHHRKQNHTPDFRGLVAVVETLLNLQVNQKSDPTQPHYPILTSCHIHEDLEVWGFWKLIFNQIQDCSVISCHEEICQFLQEKHDVTVEKLYKIPSEYKYSQLFDYQDQQNQPHYPNYFEQISSEIKVNYPGEVFLVAAGFLGKIYCHIIKQRGGIALDVGSVVDHWLNYQTRGSFQNARLIHYSSLFSKVWQLDDQVSQNNNIEHTNNSNTMQLLTAQDYVKKANNAVRQNNNQEAIKYYCKAIEMDQELSPQIYQKLVNQLVKKYQFEEAEAIGQQLLKKYPDKIQTHNCLVHIAMTSGELDLAVTRLDSAIALFPDKLDFVLEKINLLQRLCFFKQTERTIRKARRIFSPKVELDLAEAKLYQHKYDYHSAGKIIEIAFAKEPDNIEVQMARAYNNSLLGKRKIAKKILNEIRPQLDFSRGAIIAKFTELYTDILQRDGQIEELRAFFKDAIAKQAFNKSTMIIYYKFLIDQGQYKKAFEAIEDFITQDTPNFYIYKNKLLMLFELEKIRHIQNINNLKLDEPLPSRGIDYSVFLLEKIEAYLENNSVLAKVNQGLREILDKVHKLHQKYPRTFLNTSVSPYETYEIASEIIERINNKIPMSLIRLGDAEGMFLEYEKKWPKFQEKDRQRIQRIYWGSIKINRQEWSKIKDDYRSALQNADILGIPGFNRFCRELRPKFSRQDYGGELRGLVTIVDSLLNSNSYQKNHNSRTSHPTLTSCHIHQNLEAWGLYPLIFEQLKDCSIISCHQDVTKVLWDKYKLTVNKFYLIPSEYKFSQLFDYQNPEEQPHYPYHYRKICAEITVDYPGEVFLVGAGLFGKIYCNIIKQRGGIALDIGSILDYWLEHNTRGELKFHTSVDDFTNIFSRLLEKNLVNSASKKIVMNDENYGEKAVALAKEGDTKTAIDDIEIIANKYLKLANDLIEERQIERAITNYRKAIALQPTQPPQVYRKLGNQLLTDKRFAEAEEIWQKFVEQYPEKQQGYIGLARVAMSSKNWKLAQQRWKQILQLFSENITALVGLGNTLIELKKYNQAEVIFQDIINKHPSNHQGYEGLAKLASTNYERELAIKWWDISIQKTQAKSSYLKKARLLINFAQYKEGIAAIDNLIAHHGENLETLKIKADLLISASQYLEAIEILVRLRSQDSESLSIQILLAQAFINNKQFAEAIAIIENFPEFYPEKISNYQSDLGRKIRLLKSWHKYFKAGVSFDKPKIFGIGLGKTGTTSLNEALNNLGYAAIHFINPITRKIIDIEDIFYYDAFCDSPISFRFEELYFLFPNAKFIYTERNVKDWIKSSMNEYKPFGFTTTKEMKFWLTHPNQNKFNKRDFYYNKNYCYAYESLYANYPTWEDAYYAFDNRINHFFADKPPEKLLKINICAGEKWLKLCQFLNLPIPKIPFPYFNKK